MVEAIKAIIKSQFEYLAKHMKEGKIEPVRLKNLGVFLVKPRFKKFNNF